jgi:mannose-6-phosphate isomerase-like protein (cupin superfamily)
MAVQRWRVAECDILNKTGIQSRQLIWSNNSPEAQVTVTHVTMVPGSLSKRHAHARSEQIWIVEQGEGLLLLADDRAERLRAGDIVRTPAGEVHGVENTGSDPLIYLAVTTPPQNFAKAYDPPAEGDGG